MEQRRCDCLGRARGLRFVHPLRAWVHVVEYEWVAVTESWKNSGCGKPTLPWKALGELKSLKAVAKRLKQDQLLGEGRKGKQDSATRKRMTDCGLVKLSSWFLEFGKRPGTWGPFRGNWRLANKYGGRICVLVTPFPTTPCKKEPTIAPLITGGRQWKRQKQVRGTHGRLVPNHIPTQPHHRLCS